MQRLFGTEIHNLAWGFRDYVREQYHVELILRSEPDIRGVETLNVYLPDNSPHAHIIQQETARYLTNPFDAKYHQASWTNGDTQAVKMTAPNLSWSQTFMNWRQIKFTIFLTALCIAVYLFEIIGYDQSIMFFAHYPAEFGEDQQLWRYFSHSLVHLSPLHILFNLCWWWIFAGAIERHLGAFTLITLYFLSAIISGTAQNFVSGPAFFGLSGVVYAVMGFVFATDKFGKTQGTLLPQGFFTMLVIGILFGFVSPLIGVKMGNTAHISGLITGLIYGFLYVKTRQNREIPLK